MDGAIGFSGEKSTGKVILEPIAKNKVKFVTLCNWRNIIAHIQMAHK